MKLLSYFKCLFFIFANDISLDLIIEKNTRNGML